MPFEDEFLVASINKDATIGMPFLRRHRGELMSEESKIEVNGELLCCMDRKGQAISAKLHVLLEVKIPNAVC